MFPVVYYSSQRNERKERKEIKERNGTNGLTNERKKHPVRDVRIASSSQYQPSCLLSC